MTIEEALTRIREAGRCFVIFDADTGEVLEVRGAEEATTPGAIVGTMGTAAKAHGSVKGRFFDGAAITREALEHEAKESRQVAARVSILSRWSVMPAEELVRILETDEFGPPMDAFHGPRVVIGRIFDYPPEILLPLVPRLERTQQTFVARGFEDAVRLFLQSKLAVLAGDFAGLKKVWEAFHTGIFSALVWHPDLLACIGDLRPRDPEAIEILTRTVSAPDLMFGTRCEALQALGKVGAPAGPRAAQGIRDRIYDSEPWIIELRERVLSRIEMPESAWTGCTRCYWGRVPGRPWQAPENCATCLGLGFVRCA